SSQIVRRWQEVRQSASSRESPSTSDETSLQSIAMLLAILVPVALAMAAYVAILLRAVIARKASPNIEAVALGAVVNFFDTLGIGSFATTTAWLRFRKLRDTSRVAAVRKAGSRPADPADVDCGPDAPGNDRGYYLSHPARGD